jgi:hypothetical protein
MLNLWYFCKTFDQNNYFLLLYGMRHTPKNRQRDARGTPFRQCTGTSKLELNDLAKWFPHAKSPVNFHINILHSITK